MSPSGKATVSESVMRWFEPNHPSQRGFMFISKLTFDEIKKVVKQLLDELITVEKHKENILRTMTIVVVDDYVQVVFKYKNEDHKIELFDFDVETTLLKFRDTFFIAEYRKIMAKKFFSKNSKGQTVNKYMEAMSEYMKKKIKNKDNIINNN